MTPARAIILYLVVGLALIALAGRLDAFAPRFAGLIYFGLAFALVGGLWAVKQNNRLYFARRKWLDEFIKGEK